MPATDKLICVTCPKGCRLEVTHDGQTVIQVVDAGCKRGQDYAAGELTDPRRMVATTVRITGALHPLLPVHTASPFPKPRIPDLLAELRQVEIQAPVTTGQVILNNILGTGVDILASRDMQRT
jgi:CxxC motif-containing protein